MAIIVAVLAVLCLLLIALDPRPRAKGTLGAADVNELVERYKEAHRKKDIEALRSIYVQLRFGQIAPLITGLPIWGDRMAGTAEESMPRLFDFDLVDVEVVHVPPNEFGATSLDYLIKRKPVKENGFSPVSKDSVHCRYPYKILLLGRRRNDPRKQMMELDPGLGVGEHEGRLYLYASAYELEVVADWVQTGRLPPVYRSPDHQPIPIKSQPKQIPDDFVRIVRPRT